VNKFDLKNLPSYIDHTNLRPDASIHDISRLVTEAWHLQLYSVCVAPVNVELVKGMMSKNDPVKTVVVIGFPHGNSTIKSKVQQIKESKVDEYDVVVNIGAIKDAKWDLINSEFKAIRESTNKVIKYIVEVGYLTDKELKEVADALIKNKIDFIKTCTGSGPRNVEVSDIQKIKKHVKNRIKIKASGGIKTLIQAQGLVEAGADRIGTSSSVAIMKELTA